MFLFFVYGTLMTGMRGDVSVLCLWDINDRNEGRCFCSLSMGH